MTSVKDLTEKYEALVWYARKPRIAGERVDLEYIREHYGSERGDAIIQGAYDGAVKVEQQYPEEVDALNAVDDSASWKHGFNSGMLAALRLMRPRTRIDQQRLEEFPMLDT